MQRPLSADTGEAAFTKTVATDASAVKVLFAPSARVDFLLWEHGVEREEDNEGDANS